MERMSELQALYADTTTSTNDTTLYSTEFTALRDSLVAMSDDTVNSLTIFRSTGISVSVNDALTTTDAVTFGAANLGGDLMGTTVTTDDVAIAALSITGVTTLNAAIQTVAGFRATNGSSQSNLGFQLELASAAKVNQESAISRIMDVDVAQESTQLARWNTLVQAGTSMIAQANGSAQSALQLLR
jgi:flagellin